MSFTKDQCLARHLMEKPGVPNRKLASSLSGLGAMGFPVSMLLFIQMPQIPIRDGKGEGGNQWQQLFMGKLMKLCLPSPAPGGR